MRCDAFDAGVTVTDPVTGQVTVISLPGQWPANSDAGAAAGALCKASFSGNASLSRYNLAAGQCVTVRIGELLMDNGASSNCTTQLPACTCHVFRAFAHADSSRQRSAFSDTIRCSTSGCDDDPPCDPKVRSQGYWKNKPWPAGSDSLTVGCQTYSASELLSILNTQPMGNGAVALMHQVIATRLNIVNGARQAYVDATAADLAAAEQLLCTTAAVPPVGAGYLAPAAASSLTFALDGQISVFECQGI